MTRIAGSMFITLSNSEKSEEKSLLIFWEEEEEKEKFVRTE